MYTGMNISEMERKGCIDCVSHSVFYSMLFLKVGNVVDLLFFYLKYFQSMYLPIITPFSIQWDGSGTLQPLQQLFHTLPHSVLSVLRWNMDSHVCKSTSYV